MKYTQNAHINYNTNFSSWSMCKMSTDAYKMD